MVQVFWFWGFFWMSWLANLKYCHFTTPYKSSTSILSFFFSLEHLVLELPLRLPIATPSSVLSCSPGRVWFCHFLLQLFQLSKLFFPKLATLSILTSSAVLSSFLYLYFKIYMVVATFAPINDTQIPLFYSWLFIHPLVQSLFVSWF